jgi:hypothetical protein
MSLMYRAIFPKLHEMLDHTLGRWGERIADAFRRKGRRAKSNALVVLRGHSE